MVNKEDSLSLELDGKVYIVDVKDGKTTRSELDGQIVLKVLVQAISDGVGLMEQEHAVKTK